MGDEFHAILLEGLFFLAEDRHFRDILVQTPTGIQPLYAALCPLIGQRVYFAVHHVPSDPIDPSRWGGGSCLWQPAARCPFGHHEHPTRLFNLTAQGMLTYAFDPDTNSEGWSIACLDGSRVVLPLATCLPGHTARVAAATVLSVEQMRDSAGAAGMNVEGLGQRVTDLRDLVGDLGRILKRN